MINKISLSGYGIFSRIFFFFLMTENFMVIFFKIILIFYKSYYCIGKLINIYETLFFLISIKYTFVINYSTRKLHLAALMIGNHRDYRNSM